MVRKTNFPESQSIESPLYMREQMNYKALRPIRMTLGTHDFLKI